MKKSIRNRNVVETVVEPVVEPVVETIVETLADEPTDENVVETVADEPASETLADEPVEPVVRHHITFVPSARQTLNGIPSPAYNGLCHAAWRVFDSLTLIVDGEPQLPTLLEALIVNSKEHFLNAGNLRVEFPRWKKYNNFVRR